MTSGLGPMIPGKIIQFQGEEFGGNQDFKKKCVLLEIAMYRRLLSRLGPRPAKAFIAILRLHILLISITFLPQTIPSQKGSPTVFRQKNCPRKHSFVQLAVLNVSTNEKQKYTLEHRIFQSICPARIDALHQKTVSDVP
jgi:hypothetical protein